MKNTNSRSASLDGVRGLAALSVLVSHIVQVLHGVQLKDRQNNIASLFFYLGEHAVWIFFVLSGFVLYKPAKRLSERIASYFKWRLVRLYVPVWLAIALTLFVSMALPRTGNFGIWFATHPAQYNAQALIQDILLLFGTSGNLSPIWSLTWEMWFSLLIFPLLKLVSRFRYSLFLLFTLPAISYLGKLFTLPPVQYLPMFVLGLTLAHLIAERGKQSEFLTRWSKALSLLTLLTLFLVLALKLVLPLNVYEAIDIYVNLLLFCWLIYACATDLFFKDLLSSTIPSSLGKISFSLYLVHETVLLALVQLSGGEVWATLISIPLSLLAAYGFYLVVERPSQIWARNFLASS